VSDWPQIGDSIWTTGSDWEAEALLGASFDWFFSYASSYKAAANTVLERVEAKQIRPDEVSYAVFFLYRHYVEIMLKGLIRIGSMLHFQRGESQWGKFPQHHRIIVLWQQCRPLIEEAYRKGEKAETDAVENILKELHGLDPTGESFRFGESRDGKPTLSSNPQIDLIHVRNIMTRLSGFLEANYAWMDHLLGFDADI
jgi:hypothetical protein